MRRRISPSCLFVYLGVLPLRMPLWFMGFLDTKTHKASLRHKLFFFGFFFVPHPDALEQALAEFFATL